jgi:NAD(P)-dependent dehydrogenase (short-subunit alcohol dehydrogenase family)
VKGRVALVTGASRGIGHAIAARFEELGAQVIAPTRAELDLAEPASISGFVAALAESVDILVNDAGVNPLARLSETDDDLLESTIQVNLFSALRLCRALVPQMAARGWGRVVNLSSVWTVVGKEGRLPYIVSKTGLNGLTRALAVEFGPQGVLVNAVAPGFVMTEMTAQNNTPEQLARVSDGMPLRRLAEPSEIAELVAFLASSRSSFMTGQVLVCDGGYSIV